MTAGKRGSRELWLLGQPTLQQYINHVRKHVLGGEAIAKSDLVDEWRAANDHYYDLEEKEAGFPDTTNVKALSPKLNGLVEELRASGPFRNAFDDLPTRVAMVELEKLIVAQSSLDLDHAENLTAKLGPTPTPEELFRFCLPIVSEQPKVHVRRAGSKRYFFWSKSHDFRFHEAALLQPQQIKGYESFGPLAAVLGFGVGFGSNFLTVIESDKRHLLHNGHHRAYALKQLGIKFAPCIVQTVTRLDELHLVAASDVVNSPGYYFNRKRPPVLKDFFDKKLAKVLNVSKSVRMVEISFDIKEFDIKDFKDSDPSLES